MITFPYFADPVNFAYLAEPGTQCGVCGLPELCFDTAGCTGTGSITAACPSCLKTGKLIEIDVSTNDVGGDYASKLNPSLDAAEHSTVIAYCTPQLPTWQDMEWPILEGDFCRFIKIASRTDFTSKEELLSLIPQRDWNGRDAGELWDMVPEARITNLKDGNFDVSFYLFASKTQKLVLWDCN